MMCECDRLRFLQMGKSWHNRLRIFFHNAKQYLQQLFQQFIRLKNLLPGIQTHVQCHLIISASSGMQFLSGISQTVNKVCFHKTVNILIFRSDGKLSALHIRKNFL